MQKLITLRRSILLTLSFALLSAVGFAQTGTIRGRVQDARDEGLTGASVAIQGTTKGGIVTSNGTYEITNVTPGSYTLVATFVGFKNSTQAVTVQGSEAAVANFTLADDALEMDQLIVTGTFDPRTKLESSVAITTLNPRAIELRAPRGTGDLLQSVPGVWVDNSSGEVGTKVVARGLAPVGNDQIGFQYVSLQEEGLPVMASQIGFAVVDMFHRVDLTTGRMESIRGGSAAIAAANAPGGIFNFISKTGGNQFAGSARLQGGVYNNGNGIGRLDVEFGAPIANGWHYHVGGFLRNDDGARDLPFVANRGGQLKFNLTKQTDKLLVKFWAKYLNDQNTFFKEIPLNADLKSGYQACETCPAYNINNSTTFLDVRATVPEASQFRASVPFAETPTRTLNSRNGIRNYAYTAGLELGFDLGNGWNLNNKARFSYLTQDYVQFQGNSVLPVVPSLSVPNNQGYLQFGAGALAGLPAPLGGLFIPSLLSPTYTDTRTGQVLARVNRGVLDPTVPNQLGKYMLVTAPLNMQNSIRDAIDILSLSKQAGNHQLTLGAFGSLTQTATRWYVDGVATSLVPGANPVAISFPAPAAPLPGGLGGGGTYQATDPNGLVLQSGLAYTVTNINAYIGALFANDVWKVSDRVSVDAGVRFETVWHQGSKQGWQGATAAVAVAGNPLAGLGGLDRNPRTTYDLGSRVFNGVNYDFDFTYRYLSGSLGLNWKLRENAAVYVRGTYGNKAPETDFYANNFVNVPIQRGVIESVTQAELGYKVNSKNASLSITGFYSYLDNVLLQLFINNGANSFFTDPTFNATRTVGAEIEAAVSPFKNFSIRAIATIQDARYAKLTYQNTAGSVIRTNFFNEDFSGNRVLGIAPIILDITPTYRIGKFSPYVNWRFMSERSGNRRNTINLAAYSVFNAGISGEFGKVTALLQVSNTFNSAGILLFGGYGLQGTTAEDLAVGGVRNPNTGQPLPNTDITQLNQLGAPVFARPILARQILASLTYRF